MQIHACTFFCLNPKMCSDQPMLRHSIGYCSGKPLVITYHSQEPHERLIGAVANNKLHSTYAGNPAYPSSQHINPRTSCPWRYFGALPAALALALALPLALRFGAGVCSASSSSSCSWSSPGGAFLFLVGFDLDLAAAVVSRFSFPNSFFSCLKKVVKVKVYLENITWDQYRIGRFDHRTTRDHEMNQTFVSIYQIHIVKDLVLSIEGHQIHTPGLPTIHQHWSVKIIWFKNQLRRNYTGNTASSKAIYKQETLRGNGRDQGFWPGNGFLTLAFSLSMLSINLMVRLVLGFLGGWYLNMGTLFRLVEWSVGVRPIRLSTLMFFSPHLFLLFHHEVCVAFPFERTKNKID